MSGRGQCREEASLVKVRPFPGHLKEEKEMFGVNIGPGQGHPASPGQALGSRLSVQYAGAA